MTTDLARVSSPQALVENAEWDSPMFRLAQNQFLQAAEIMGLDENVRERLLFPQRTTGEACAWFIPVK